MLTIKQDSDELQNSVRHAVVPLRALTASKQFSMLKNANFLNKKITHCFIKFFVSTTLVRRVWKILFNVMVVDIKPKMIDKYIHIKFLPYFLDKEYKFFA